MNTKPELLTVTYETQLLELPKEILLPLNPDPVDEITNCTVGQYLQSTEGPSEPAGTMSWLRCVLEDFDNLGELIWRPE